MDKNETRLKLGAEINALAAERDSTKDAKEKAAAIAAIAKLQNTRRLLNIIANAAIGARIDTLLSELEEIRTSTALDAVSALGRTIGRLREARGGAVGNG